MSAAERIQIRLMTEADHSVWAEMRARLWPDGSPEAHLHDLKILAFRHGRHFGWLAHSPEGEPLGFAEATIRDDANGCCAAPTPFLEGVWVEPGHRREGVGRALMRQISEHFAVKGFNEICSEAEISNHAAHLAHAGGFAETERVVDFRKPLGEPPPES